jgi:hypothetical protein
MSAEGKATTLKRHSIKLYHLDWQSGALIRCIGWLACILLMLATIMLCLPSQMIRCRRGNRSPIKIKTVVVNGLGATTREGLSASRLLL